MKRWQTRQSSTKQSWLDGSTCTSITGNAPEVKDVVKLLFIPRYMDPSCIGTFLDGQATRIRLLSQPWNYKCFNCCMFCAWSILDCTLSRSANFQNLLFCNQPFKTQGHPCWHTHMTKYKSPMLWQWKASVVVGTPKNVFSINYSCSDIPDSYLVYAVLAVFFSFAIHDVNSTRIGKNGDQLPCTNYWNNVARFCI